MGGCVSKNTGADRDRSDAIDKQIEEDNKRYRRECKILLLGSGDSGKSTIVKQMKIIHKGGFTKADLAEFKPIIYRNIIESARTVILHMRKRGLQPSEISNLVSNKAHRLFWGWFVVKRMCDKILEHPFDPTGKNVFSSDIADAIHKLWKDPVIPQIMEEYSEDLYIMDSAG